MANTLSDKANSGLAEYPLPGFVIRRANGLSLDLSAFDSTQLLYDFIDRLYGSGFRLADGEYELIQKLLYETTPKDIDAWSKRLESMGKPAEVRLAGDIDSFPDERRFFYRGWRASSNAASVEYFFEPIYLERLIEEPMLGEADASGNRPVIGNNPRVINEIQTLEIDEYFASAWLNGVRFGWNVPRIKAEFARDGGRFRATTKVVVAEMVAPTQGQDATLLEQADTMHRNDAPKMLRDGRVDLTQFRNRFPQVKQQTRLLKKMPRELGIAGHDVSGKALPPDVPHDFSLDELAGPGTRIERNADGEFVVATIDGFLNIDAQTNLISVTEKIINKDGVSVRTTGNLLLQGDEFEEHGEVQERRQVEGFNMTFMADVFGNIVSRGGKISIQKHLAGGSAKTRGGLIEVVGGASRAVIEAPDGEVIIKFAESSRIVGRRVRIERACLCEIIAEEVTIELAEGCAIAAQRVHLGSATPRKNAETTVVISLPDLAGIDKAITLAKESITAIDSKIAALSARQQELLALPELKTYMMVQKKRAAGEITMTPDQEAQFRTLSAKAAPAIKQTNDLRSAVQVLLTQKTTAEQNAIKAQQDKQTQMNALSCEIALVNGETVVRTRTPLPDEVPLEQLPHRDLKIRLREMGNNSRQIFAGSTGSFSWRWPAD